MKGGREGGREGGGGLHAGYVSAGAAAFDIWQERGGTTFLFVNYPARVETYVFFTPM